MAFEDNESKVERGSKLRIKASTFNKLVDAAKVITRNQAKVGSGIPSSTIQSNLSVLVKNSTGDNLSESFQVLRILEPLFDISIDPLNSNDPAAFDTDIPDSVFNAIAITCGPILEDEIGKAVTNGITVAKVKFNSTSHLWANPVPGETDYLETASLGQARILMDLGSIGASGDTLESGEESGSGSGVLGDIRWCVINLIGSIFADESDSGSTNLGTGKLTEFTGAGSLTKRTLDGSGNWIDNGTITNAIYAAEIAGVAWTPVVNGNGIYWEEPVGSGRYAYLSLHYAAQNLSGFVSTVAQSFSGDKTFIDDVIALSVTANTTILSNSLRTAGTNPPLRVLANNSADDYLIDSSADEKWVSFGPGTGIVPTAVDHTFSFAGTVSLVQSLYLVQNVAGTPIGANIAVGIEGVRTFIEMCPSGSTNVPIGPSGSAPSNTSGICFKGNDGGGNPASMHFPTDGNMIIELAGGSQSIGQTTSIVVKNSAGNNMTLYFQNGWFVASTTP